MQYVDDLFIASKDRDSYLQTTRDLLQTLCQLGYKVSSKKAYICAPKVTYLGYILKKGKRWLSPAQKQTILDIPSPKTWNKSESLWVQADFADSGYLDLLN